MFFKKGLGGEGGWKAKKRIKITKVTGKNVKNESSHCLTYFFLVYCGKLQDSNIVRKVSKFENITQNF